MPDDTSPDQRIRREVYSHCLALGRPPTAAALASALGLSAAGVRAGLDRLAQAHVLVLQPESGEILMANPFSAVPTPFLAATPAFSAYANCIWDGLGVAAMTGQDTTIETACGDCGQALRVRLRGGALRDPGGLVHFALPARTWWDDIVFT